MKAVGMALRLAGAALFVATASACGQGGQTAGDGEAVLAASAPVPEGCLLGAVGDIGGPISLIDQTGAAVTQENFHEAPTLIYFGFTYCPDVCPLALQAEKAALATLGQGGQVVQPVLITIDPERDTPEKLAQYVSSKAFPEGLLGLSGSPAQIDDAAKAFRVTYQKQVDDKSAASYTMAHSSFFYLMDENWRLVAMYPSSLSPAQQGACIKAGLRREENPN